MPQSASYYPQLKLVVVRVWGVMSMALFSARMAEWMYEFHVPKGYDFLTDARGLQAVDRAETGVQELVTMQARIYEELPAPDRSLILVDSPVGYVMSRLFEHMADGVLDEEVSVFQSEGDALAHLGYSAETLEQLVVGQTDVMHRD